MSDDPTGKRTEEALERSGMADMRPAYRKLLLRLKETEPAAFAEATRRYREGLEPAIASEDRDPILSWLEYGVWLAGRFGEGRPLAIDPTGRAREFDPGVVPEPGDMILFMPEDDRTPANLLAVPREPTDSQKETAALLIG